VASSRSSKPETEAGKKAKGARASEGRRRSADALGAGGAAMGGGMKDVPAMGAVGEKRRRSQLEG
jgi:hypothetical protein